MTEEHNHDHDYITLIDEEGNEELHEILFTFESDDSNAHTYSYSQLVLKKGKKLS